MKKTLYLKFLLAYLIFGVFGFIIVSIFVPSMTEQTLTRDKANTLYSEATLIANTYASGLYSSSASLETVKLQIDALSVYMNSEIQIINPSGRIVLDSNTPININEAVYIEDFDPTIISGSFYIIDDFFGSFDHDVLTVISPITTDYFLKGYVAIHASISDIQNTS
ncbi:MAG: two-component sensor histidine kinase, partial [Lachnospiraceae bacterium]|nr:two-component sensor histidine kinase [Lachnospiraceae bacterium]